MPHQPHQQLGARSDCAYCGQQRLDSVACCVATWASRSCKAVASAGADVDVVNEAGRSAAELVSENGQAELANFISEYKANSNSRNMLRSTTLDSVEYDAEVDRIYDAKASLHAAVEEGDMDTMKLLLKRGVDTNSRGANYETPLE